MDVRAQSGDPRRLGMLSRQGVQAAQRPQDGMSKGRERRSEFGSNGELVSMSRLRIRPNQIKIKVTTGPQLEAAVL